MSKISLDPKIEKKIIEKARKDKSEFAPIYSHYKKHILDFFSFRVSDFSTAEELTSTTFEKSLKSLDNFQWQGVSFSAWLYRIARNTLIDYYRRENNKTEASSLDLVKEIPSKEAPPHEKVETMFAEEQLYEVLQQLPPREKEIIYLKFFDGYTNKVISEVTGLSETNVGTIIYRTIRRLRKMYKESK